MVAGVCGPQKGPSLPAPSRFHESSGADGLSLSKSPWFPVDSESPLRLRAPGGQLLLHLQSSAPGKSLEPGSEWVPSRHAQTLTSASLASSPERGDGSALCLHHFLFTKNSSQGPEERMSV